MGQGNGTGGEGRTRCDRPEKRKLGHPVAPFPPRAPRQLNPSRSTWSRRDQVRRQRRRVRACVSPASALLALGLSLAPRYVPLLWCCLSPVAACVVAPCCCLFVFALSLSPDDGSGGGLGCRKGQRWEIYLGADAGRLPAAAPEKGRNSSVRSPKSKKTLKNGNLSLFPIPMHAAISIIRRNPNAPRGAPLRPRSGCGRSCQS